MVNRKSEKPTTIGIIGLGIMGGKIAGKFMKRGYQVFIYDISKSVVRKFEDKGAVACSSPKEVAQKSSFVFEVTPNDESSREVWDGANGILAGATDNKVLITCATLSVAWVDELAKKCNS